MNASVFMLFSSIIVRDLAATRMMRHLSDDIEIYECQQRNAVDFTFAQACSGGLRENIQWGHKV
jgi:hypothetical protein